MADRARMNLLTLFLMLSIAMHLAALPFVPGLVHSTQRIEPEPPESQPIVLTFKQPEPELRQQLIDSGAPAEEPLEESDFISDQDSVAQDMSDAEGELDLPSTEEVSDVDQLGTPPASPPSEPVEVAAPPVEPVVPQAAEPQVEASPAPEAVEQLEPVQEDPSPIVVAEVPGESDQPDPSPEPLIEEEKIIEEETQEAEEVEEELPERFEVAQAPERAEVEAQVVRSTNTSERGGAEQSGFTSFEAIQHELGEYMLQVRSRVEVQWRSALHLRYSGVSRTMAIIECSIRPDGTLEYARIAEQGTSLTHAILCREAIKKAAPFGAFPFDVPQIYREQNLELRWRFSYL